MVKGKYTESYSNESVWFPGYGLFCSITMKPQLDTCCAAMGQCLLLTPRLGPEDPLKFRNKDRSPESDGNPFFYL